MKSFKLVMWPEAVFLSFFMIALLPCSSGAETDYDEIGFVYQTVAAPFEPARTLLLLETQVGEVLQVPAYSVEKVSDSRSSTDRMFLVGANFPRDVLRVGSKEFHFTFFLMGPEGKFAATPVRRWSPELVEKHSDSPAELAKKTTQYVSEMKKLELSLAAVEEEHGEMKQRASEIAGVSEIIDLKMKLTELQGFGESKAEEIERLQSLIDRGRRLKDDAEMRLRIQELSTDLKETAKATAMADRLNARRRTAARSALREKLRLIKKYRAVDLESLAQKLLALRAERRKLELRLQPNPRGQEEQEF